MIEVNLLELISNYEKKQREARIEPPYITEVELKNIVIDKVNDELNKLYRDKQSAKFYHSKQWQAMRKAVLNDEPFCRICGRPAKIVDHIQPIKQGGAALDIANLQPLCQACHNAKTNKESK